jgi:hypothetical protein
VTFQSDFFSNILNVPALRRVGLGHLARGDSPRGSPWNGCWSLAEIATVEVTIDIVNSSSARMRVWIELWCSEHFLAVGQRLKLVVEDPVEPTFDVQEQEAETIVWLNRHSSAYIVDRGVRRQILDCWCETPVSPIGDAG